MMATTKPTAAQLRILQAIERTHTAPRRTRIDVLNRMRDAGLIGPLANRDEPWYVTRAGKAAIEKAEIDQACRGLAAQCQRILGEAGA